MTRPARGYGELVLTRIDDWRTGQYELRVDRADPRIMIAAEILDEIARGDDAHARLDGDVLTITGTNQKVIYRIGEYHLVPDCYEAEWPD